MPAVLAEIEHQKGLDEVDEVDEVRKANPRQVRQMLMRTSAPQPAIRNTPTGGTVDQERISSGDRWTGIAKSKKWRQGRVRKMVTITTSTADTGLGILR